MIAASLSFSIHTTSVRVNTERIRERVTAIASTATVEFRAADLNALRTMKDVDTPQYRTVVERLKQIRRRNPDIMYAYLLRPAAAGTLFEFIADADAEHPSKIPDTNRDGRITSADDLGFPGVQYDIAYIDVLKNREFSVPVATREPYTDKWGTFFTGYAPIRDTDGTIVALIAVDMTIGDLARYSRQTYSPIIGFALMFLLFVVLRFAATNNHALLQLIPSGRRYLRPRILLSAACLLFLLAAAFVWWRKEVLIRSYGEKAMAIAATAAPHIDAKDLEVLRTAEDMKRPEYQRVFATLNQIRAENPGVQYVDIFRQTSVDGIWEFVADADANFDVYHVTDTNADGLLDAKDENTWPGMAYDARGYSEEAYNKAFQQPYFVVVSDQWGTFLSGNAPVYDDKGIVVGELNVNYDLKQILRDEFGSVVSSAFTPESVRVAALFFLILFVTLLIRFVYVNQKVLRVLMPKSQVTLMVRGVLAFIFVVLLAGFLIFRQRTEMRIKNVGERAQSIAATAALLIDSNDLVSIRTYKDMRRPEYQKMALPQKNLL